MKRITPDTVIFSFLLLTVFVRISFSTDSLSFQWPYQPFDGSHFITGAFAEYRTTSPSHHFHDGVDIPIPDYSPVYPSLDGVVHSIGTVSDHGGGAWVRVRTNVDGMWKHISYVHISPNPALSVGDEVVAGETTLGTIIPGWGHVHFRERELVTDPAASGADINAIRKGGGLTPFINNRAPVIAPETLQFRTAGTTSRLDPRRLHGNVEILIRAHGHYGPNPIHQRRGIYKLGYHIMSEDTSTIVYSPPDDGLRYQFDRKPVNSHVNRVFVREYSTNRVHHYYLTGGDGASDVNRTLSVSPNYLDTGNLPNGNFVIKIFAEDTRNNADTIYAAIAVHQAPQAPILRAVTFNDNNEMIFTWNENTEDNLGGYRLYYDHPDGWRVAVFDTFLTKEISTFTIRDPDEFFDLGAFNDIVNFAVRLVAVNDLENPIESSPSNKFFIKNADWDDHGISDRYSVLVVDGIQEGEGQVTWHQRKHPFIVRYGSALPFEAVVSSARESAVMDSTVTLSEYNVVLWFIGSRGFQTTSFSNDQQLFLRDYLENGGKLIVSGSAIGRDLGRTSTEGNSADSLFYADYLRAIFVAHSAAGFNPKVHGLSGTLFADFDTDFNQYYSVGWTDDIAPGYGAEQLLHYQSKRPDGSHRGAAIGYKGTFGESLTDGGIVYFAFPVETIEDDAKRWELMVYTFQYFDFVTSLDDSRIVHTIPDVLSMSSNYPNPFNMATSIDVRIPERSAVTLKVYDMLGREIATLMDDDLERGLYTVIFDATGLASGTYYARLKSADMIKTQSMILLK